MNFSHIYIIHILRQLYYFLRSRRSILHKTQTVYKSRRYFQFTYYLEDSLNIHKWTEEFLAKHFVLKFPSFVILYFQEGISEKDFEVLSSIEYFKNLANKGNYDGGKADVRFFNNLHKI